MTKSHTRSIDKLDPYTLSIDFALDVRQAFGDLAAAVHFSEHFDPDMLLVLQEWAHAARPAVHDVISTLPAVAEQTFRHIAATQDKRALDAWHELQSALLEGGFSIANIRSRS